MPDGLYELPQGWTWVTLGDVCEIVRSQVDPRLSPHHNFNYLSIENVESNSGELVKFKPTMGSEIKSGKIAFSNKDILYSKLRPYLNKVHLPQFDGISATDLIPIRPLGNIPREYIAYYLRTRYVVEYSTQRMRGIQLPRVSVDDLHKLSLPLGPLNEQHRIVEVIDRSLKTIRLARNALNNVPRIMGDFRQSVLARAFRGKLTERDPNDEPAERLLERIAQECREKRKYRLKEKGKVSGKYEYKKHDTASVDAVQSLPAGWAWSRVDRVAEVRLGRQRSPKNRSAKYPRKYLRAANVLEDGFDLSDVKDMDFKPNEFETYKLRPGDVLLSEGSGTVEPSNRTLGTCAVWDGRVPDYCFQNTLILVRSSHIPPRYLLHAFTYARYNGDFARIAKGIGIAHLGAQRLSAHAIPIAPKNEQLRIVKTVDSMLAMSKNVEASVQTVWKNSKELEDAILDRAFRGELAPQNPKDEPASILLEKIRTRRTTPDRKMRPVLELSNPIASSTA